jgi:hypothetical protein
MRRGNWGSRPASRSGTPTNPHHDHDQYPPSPHLFAFAPPSRHFAHASPSQWGAYPLHDPHQQPHDPYPPPQQNAYPSPPPHFAYPSQPRSHSHEQPRQYSHEQPRQYSHQPPSSRQPPPQHDNSSSRYPLDQRYRDLSGGASHGASRGTSRCASPEPSLGSFPGPSRNSFKPRFTTEEKRAHQGMQVCTKVQDGRFYCTSDQCGRGHHGQFKDPHGFTMVRGKVCIPSPALHTMPRNDNAAVPEVPDDVLLSAADAQLAELRLGTKPSN